MLVINLEAVYVSPMQQLTSGLLTLCIKLLCTIIDIQ